MYILLICKHTLFSCPNFFFQKLHNCSREFICLFRVRSKLQSYTLFLLWKIVRPSFVTRFTRRSVTRWVFARFADGRRATGKPEIAIAAEEESVESRTLVFPSTTLNRSRPPRRDATQLGSTRVYIAPDASTSKAQSGLSGRAMR